MVCGSLPILIPLCGMDRQWGHESRPLVTALLTAYSSLSKCHLIYNLHLLAAFPALLGREQQWFGPFLGVFSQVVLLSLCTCSFTTVEKPDPSLLSARTVLARELSSQMLLHCSVL